MKETIFLNRNQFGRRAFLRKSIKGAVGLGVLGGIAPNLIINPIYAGTAVIIDSSTDRRVELSNASFARAFNLGTWSRLRLAILYSGEFAGALTSLTPHFVIGLCSGSTNQVFDATTTNFIGWRTTTATWNYTAGSPDGLVPGINSTDFVTKRVGSTWTNGSPPGVNGLALWRSSEWAGNNSMAMADITKGSPNWTINTFKGVATGATNVTRANYLAQAVAVTPSITDHNLGTGQTLAFDEVAGTVDHIQIGWDRSEATIQISDIAVVKMAA